MLACESLNQTLAGGEVGVGGALAVRWIWGKWSPTAPPFAFVRARARVRVRPIYWRWLGREPRHWRIGSEWSLPAPLPGQETSARLPPRLPRGPLEPRRRCAGWRARAQLRLAVPARSGRAHCSDGTGRVTGGEGGRDCASPTRLPLGEWGLAGCAA